MISQQKQNIQFADYAPLLDAEQVLRTAQVKQNLADENIATIKSTVDAYSRLRSYMINDASKNYFDQELKKLTSAIRDSAGLDFSNKGNLANVLAIGRPFENDKYIINGLKAGKEKERRMSELNSLDPSLRNEDNDLVYMQDIYDYMQNGGLDTKVTTDKAYTNYVDVTEELLKIEKDIQADIQGIQTQALQGGLLNVREVEQKTAEAIKARLANLSPEHQRQIQIHAQADMYRMGKEGTYNSVKQYMTVQKEALESSVPMARKELAEAQAIYARTKSADDLARVNKLKTELNNASMNIRALDEEIMAPPDQFDPNQYVQIFKENFLSTVVERAKYTKIKNNIKENNIMMEGIKFNNQVKLEGIKNQNRKNELFRKDISEKFTPTTNIRWKAGEEAGTLLGALNSIDKTLGKTSIGVRDAEGVYKLTGLEAARTKLQEKSQEITGTSPSDLARKAMYDNHIRTLDQISAAMTRFEKGHDRITRGVSSANKKVSTNVELPLAVNIGSDYWELRSGDPSLAYYTPKDIQNMTLEDLLIGGQFEINEPLSGDKPYDEYMSTFRTALNKKEE